MRWTDVDLELARVYVRRSAPSGFNTIKAPKSNRQRWVDLTGSRRVTVAPTEGGAVERPAVACGCNECNEALDGARNALAIARRLALLAEDAIANDDVHRAHAALRQIHRPADPPSSDAGRRGAGPAGEARTTPVSYSTGSTSCSPHGSSIRSDRE